MEQIIDQFYMCSQFADVAKTRATQSELRAFAQDCSSRQRAEIQMMQQWLFTWFKINYTPKTDSGFAWRLACFKAQCGSEFDTQFIMNMLMYEIKEVYLAQQATFRVGHNDLKGLAIDIVDVNCDEIKNMKVWLNKNKR